MPLRLACELTTLSLLLAPLVPALRYLAAEDERSFLIDASLHFRPSSFEGEPSFAWKDIDYDDEDEQANADEGELFEFVSDSRVVDKSTLTIFELTMLHCMYERVSTSACFLFSPLRRVHLCSTLPVPEIQPEPRRGDRCRPRGPQVQVSADW